MSWFGEGGLGEAFAIMRHPCLMEDEGRHEFITSFSTREEAEMWIAGQEGKYFTPSDYYILEEAS